MAKRANNEGSPRQRKDGRWEARYTDPHGKRKSLYAATEAELITKLRTTLQQIATGEYCGPSRITVGTWLMTWWKEYAVPATRKNSASVARHNIEKHILPALGKIQLQRLRADQVQAFANKLVQAEYAPATIRRIMATLKSALKQAVTNQMILRSPADGLRLPKMEQGEIQVLTAGEQRRLLEALPDTDNARMLRFMLGTGLRASEACGLRWSDIQGSVFTVRQGITDHVQYDEQGRRSLQREANAPKSKAGKRSIPLTANMLELLEEQRRAQAAQKEDAIGKGLGWAGALVFAGPLGAPKDRNNLKRTLHQALEKAGVKRVGLHALRHTFATNALQAGMDARTLSEIIGHSQIAFTLQVYAHSNMSIKRKALEAMEAAL